MAALLAALAIGGGLFGTVTRSPATPVCRVGIPCGKPAVGVTLRFLRGGRVVRSVVTRAGGRYRVFLPPGTYAVRVAPSSRFGVPRPATLAVDRTLRRVDLVIDTGIR